MGIYYIAIIFPDSLLRTGKLKVRTGLQAGFQKVPLDPKLSGLNRKSQASAVEVVLIRIFGTHTLD